MNCNCLKEIDDKLREKNLKLTGYAFVMPDFSVVPQLATDWLDRDKAPRGKKRSPPAMFASHCPFCGLPVEKAKPVPETKEKAPEPSA